MNDRQQEEKEARLTSAAQSLQLAIASCSALASLLLSLVYFAGEEEQMPMLLAGSLQQWRGPSCWMSASV